MSPRAPLRPPSLPLLGVLWAALLGATCHGGGQEVPSGPGTLAGCWTIETAASEDGAWRPVDSPGLPPAVRLDSARLDPEAWPSTSESITYRAWSLVDGAVRDHPFRAWRLLWPDSVWVGHHATYAGHTLRLGLGSDTLTGRLVTHTDVMGAEVPPPRRARLVRTACPPGVGAEGGAP